MDKMDLILEKLESMQKDIDELKEMKADVEALREGQEEIRSGVNSLLEWAEECGNVIKFPLPRVK